MHAATRSNSLVDYKNTKEKYIRNTLIRAKEPTAIASSRPMQTLISTRRKHMLANLGLLAQGAKLLTSSKMVVKGLKVRLQVAGGIWNTAGGEFVLTFGVAYWSISTAFTYVAAKLGLQFLVVLSFMGIDEGFAMHAMNNILSKWIFVSEKHRSLSLLYNGMYLGSVMGHLCYTLLIHRFGWPSVFYRLGSLETVCVALWRKVKWRRTISVAMFAATRSKFLRDWKTTKEQSMRSIVIHAKRPNAIVYSKLTLTLNCTRKATKTNREILAQGAKLSTSNRVVLMVLKMRIQVAGSIWVADTVGEEFVLTFGVARWSISTAFTHVAAKFGLQVLPAEPQPLVIIHCHDWRAAFIAPELYWDLYAPKGLNSARNFFTCLNFEYQGTAHALELASCGLDVPRLSIPDRMQDHSAHDRINPVKGALVYSNIATAVSPAYAQEVSCITRLVQGLHLIRHAIYRMLELGGQLVLLGSSPMPHIQGEFEELVNHLKDHPNVRLILKYDEVLSNSINAASDIFIMCSLFEPYCLAQMTAMRFGSVPVVRKTGGLNDSVFDVDEDTVLLQFVMVLHFFLQMSRE